MASGVNKFIGMGFLGKDPETKEVGDTSVTTIVVAINDTWLDKSGEKQERTEWVTANFWGRSGENIQKYFKKGDPIYFEGSIQTRSWEDKEGVKKYKTEVRGREWGFPPSRKSSSDGGSEQRDRNEEASHAPRGEDDIPF